jgi:hypothetical protein
MFLKVALLIFTAGYAHGADFKRCDCDIADPSSWLDPLLSFSLEKDRSASGRRPLISLSRVIVRGDREPHIIETMLVAYGDMHVQLHRVE